MENYRQPYFSGDEVFKTFGYVLTSITIGTVLGILGMLLIFFLDNKFIGLGLIGLGIMAYLFAAIMRYEVGNDEILMRLDKLVKSKQEKK